MSTKKQRMDGYIRVSTVRGREGNSYISPDVQREAIQRWADYKDVEIVEWFIDEDWSGGTHERPGLEVAVRRALDRETDGIVSWKIDRFSRHTESGLRDLARLEAVGARLAFTAEDIDTSGAIGRLVYTILLGSATYFLDNIKAGWITAKSKAVARGAKLGGTPFGYARNKDGTLSVCDVEGPIVQEAFRMAAEGCQVGEVAEYLRHAAPVRLRASNRPNGRRKMGDARNWTHRAVRMVLCNRSYLGEVRYGDGDGALIQLDAHKPLVTRKVFALAQAMAQTVKTRAPKADFPLAGVLVCDGCGEPLIGSRSGTPPRRAYRCGRDGSRRDENKIVLTCAAKAYVNAEGVEGYLIDYLQRGYKPPVADRPSEDATARIAAIEEELVAAEEELDLFADDITARAALKDRYHEKLTQRTSRVEDLRRQLREAHEALPGDKLSRAELGTLTPDKLKRALRRSGITVVVRKAGRGVREIAPRVHIGLPDDEPPAMLAA